MIGVYARVSTPDQNLARQIESAIKYTQTKYDVDIGTNQNRTVIADYIEDGAATCPADYGDLRIYFDKATGTNTNRSGFREFMDDITAGSFESVVVHSVSRLARSIRDLDRIAEEIVEDNTTALHILSEGFDLVPEDEDPYQRAMFQLLGVFAELEAEMTRRRIKEGIATRQANDDYHHGPPPLGFKKNEGRLIEASEYDRVATILNMVAMDEMSKRKAAHELDTSRRTIGRALDRPELYGLAISA